MARLAHHFALDTHFIEPQSFVESRNDDTEKNGTLDRTRLQARNIIGYFHARMVAA